MLKNAAQVKQWLGFMKPYAVALAVLLIAFFTGRTLLELIFPLTTNNALQPYATLSANEEKSFDYAFTIKDLNNQKISVEKFRGKVLFINLWATWCGPCRAEMPTIEALYQKVNREEIQFIMLSIDDDPDNQKVRRFIEKNKYTFPVFMPSGHLPQQLQVPSIPVTLIIDKQGNLVRKKTGMTNYNTGQYVRLLEELATKN